ncbi:hypothetical protein A3C96_01075 [Candidatus Uhrbacteria bacterium RIFCSPHIGHO2_02_FULL_60_10]|uniref:Uncharacterized protein n=1 Tax=Candidatus Uhrbacteria bacterium RIFCSPHIGHO2_02_FULL_60_10 TaxID=1802392 RepID=A0A1F7U2G8_9BACT|nr:MAG: hypothetical protein A3C96_01075 [Candidatus Uhrbacteria bacterium RIFCSPHIGHO2_02_FULL_60_10]
MNPEFITRVVGLVQKTNDRVVLADPSSGKAVVVMDLDSYERLMGVDAETVAAQEMANTAVVQPAREPAPLPRPRQTEKFASMSEFPVKTKVHVAVRDIAPKTSGSTDLTTKSDPAIMNRDNGARNAATERVERPVASAESRPAAPRYAQPEPSNVFEEEERFYLEPLE